MARLALGFAARLRRGQLDITLPDGRVLRCGGVEDGPSAAMTIHDYKFGWRFLRAGDIGIAESYLRREWDTPNLTQFLYVFCVNHDLSGTMLADRPLTRFLQHVRHWFNRNTKRQAKRNIFAHYDIGNEFYSAWLDPTMTYSSALFEPDTRDLTAAQQNKYRRLAEAIDLQPGHELLEIGCGWGGFAEYAAAHCGAKVVGLTISAEQRDFARARIARAGLDDKVDIRFQDYRDERGLYDRIVSIEMIEAVGEEHWPTYFKAVHDRLKPGGTAAIQAITIDEAEFEGYKSGPDFIQRFIFPGGMLLTKEAMQKQGDRAGLILEKVETFGLSYARTLRLWCERFLERWPMIAPLGYDEEFKRKWVYYLCYCEAGFTEGNIDVGIYQYRRPA